MNGTAGPPDAGLDTPSQLEIAFDASGAADAAKRGRVAAIVDVIDAATSAEASLAAGAIAVLGASPVGSGAPVRLSPESIARLAADTAAEHGTSVVIAAEPRIGEGHLRRAQAASICSVLDSQGIAYDVVANQGAELPKLIDLRNKTVVIVSSTGGTAFDAAVASGAPAVCFATTARVQGLSGMQVTALGADRATKLAIAHRAPVSIIASSANSMDDCLGAFEIAKKMIERGFLRAQL